MIRVVREEMRSDRHLAWRAPNVGTPEQFNGILAVDRPDLIAGPRDLAPVDEKLQARDQQLRDGGAARGDEGGIGEAVGRGERELMGDVGVVEHEATVHAVRADVDIEIAERCRVGEEPDRCVHQSHTHP